MRCQGIWFFGPATVKRLYIRAAPVVEKAMRRFWVSKEAYPGDTLVLSGSDARHIFRVLRMGPGDRIFLFDPTGFDYAATIVAATAARVDVRVLEKIPSGTESPLNIWLAQAFLKDRKMDEIVRQITELGVAAFIPFYARRSVPRPDSDRLSGRVKRWKKIAREALKQCGRSRMPEIRVAPSFEEVRAWSQDCEMKILFWENEAKPLSAGGTTVPVRPIRTVAVVLGPEGGFTADELETARSSGFVTAGLGPRILKADTATVAACAIIQYCLGDMGR